MLNIKLICSKTAGCRGIIPLLGEFEGATPPQLPPPLSIAPIYFKLAFDLDAIN
jgi:hypothetical protein